MILDKNIHSFKKTTGAAHHPLVYLSKAYIIKGKNKNSNFFKKY